MVRKLAGIAILFLLFSCRKEVPRACFTLSKHQTIIGDTVEFFDCSQYHGYRGQLDFGDGDGVQLPANAILKHAYGDTGDYIVVLYIGTPHNSDLFRDTVIIQQ